MQGLREKIRENSIVDRPIGRIHNNYEIPAEERKNIIDKCKKIDDVLNSLSMDHLLKCGSILSYQQLETMIQMEVMMELKDVFQKEFDLDIEGEPQSADELSDRQNSQEQEIQFAKCALISDEIGQRVQKFMRRLIEYHKNKKAKNRNKR